ncbi:3'-5' exonuclease [Pseudomonas sp. 43NM1]|uniref:3'-5' exonuclease n=1 Tax=Pseudomonas sp. 43NM1 TaxID=1904755 RepID=UPI0021156A22|nr:3'-5' exonuclease [Pseudomonas sp. 43NM1]
MSIEAKRHHLQSIQNLLAPYQYLFCVDLEATWDEVGESESPRPLAVVSAQMETIEIGLVVIDMETLEIVDELQRFVRPQINPTLTDFCKKLTSIQQADVDSAGTY